MKLPELQELVSFQSEEVILKFSRDYKITLEESKLLFRETMKMLWLMVKHRVELNDGPDCFVPDAFNVQKAMDPLDKMWHEFILFTKEYHQFCDQFFGCYLHHIPCSDKEFKAFQQRKLDLKESFVSREREDIKKFVLYIRNSLGDETLDIWFKQIPSFLVCES